MADLARFRMLIGGKAVDAISGRTFERKIPIPARAGRCCRTAAPGTLTPR